MLTIVRHAPTRAHSEHRYLGHADEPLTSAGECIARETGVRLRALIQTDDRLQLQVYTSDLTRAAGTASIALPEHAPISDVRLREMDFGAFDGHTYTENITRYGHVFTNWLADPQRCTPPHGESLAMLCTRVYCWLDEVLTGSVGRHVIAFTHAGPIRMIAALMDRIPLERALSLVIAPGAFLHWSTLQPGSLSTPALSRMQRDFDPRPHSS